MSELNFNNSHGNGRFSFNTVIFTGSGVSPTEPLILTNSAVSSIRMGSAIINFGAYPTAVDQASMTELPITSTPQQVQRQPQPFSLGVAGTTFAPLGSSKDLQNTGFNLGAGIHPIQPGAEPNDQQHIATVRKPDIMTFTLSSPPNGNSPTFNAQSILDDGYASPNPANNTQSSP
ncbi:hypothetical protein Ocin01_18874 [Orchesella cincta]|uniref:Uncharacterized protein n=1 Tax=Orchesella cincta TaxID=48709 RepID=A0A1D2M4B1_ORCCI|nr:hypothetical protein Ocin01_18874 [Orchesella cincta]